MSEALPFRALTRKASALGDDLEEELRRLRFVLGEINHAEQAAMWESARERGREMHDLHLQLARHSKYVLDVIDAQHIGNQSEAWHVGVKYMRETLEALEALHATS